MINMGTGVKLNAQRYEHFIVSTNEHFTCLRDVTTLLTYLKVLDTTNNGTNLQLGQLNKKVKYLNK